MTVIGSIGLYVVAYIIASYLFKWLSKNNTKIKSGGIIEAIFTLVTGEFITAAIMALLTKSKRI